MSVGYTMSCLLLCRVFASFPLNAWPRTVPDLLQIFPQIYLLSEALPGHTLHPHMLLLSPFPTLFYFLTIIFIYSIFFSLRIENKIMNKMHKNPCFKEAYLLAENTDN